MPAFSTHYIFAKELVPFLKETADFEVNEDAVFLGTQGPDIFFFHRILPWMNGKSLRKYGSMLHRSKPEILFENMRKYCEISNEPSIAKSYTYGFILHYALDRNCHPYVYFLQNKITDVHKLTNPHTAHNTIEFSIDSYLLNKRFGIKEPVKFNTAEIITDDKNVIEEVGRLLEYIVPKTIGKEISAKQGETAITDIKYIQNLTLDSKGCKKKILSVFETICAPFSLNYKFTAMMRPKDLEKAKKYVNIEKRKWKSPYSDNFRNESFEELFELSKADAKRMIISFLQNKSCKEITENKSFLTGVEAE